MRTKTRLFVPFILNGHLFAWIFIEPEKKIYNVHVAVRNYLTKTIWLPEMYDAQFVQRTTYYYGDGDPKSDVRETYYEGNDPRLGWTKDGFIRRAGR